MAAECNFARRKRLPSIGRPLQATQVQSLHGLQVGAPLCSVESVRSGTLALTLW